MPSRLLAVTILLCLAAFTFAQPGGTDRTDVILVLDASGSMFNRLDDGRYRITAAKEALTAFISRLPEASGLNVGLRVYGSQLLALDEGACQDSLLTVPVDGLRRGELLRSVNETQARGATPIAYSLELAAQDLSGATGRKVIVLVTDGEESCGGDVRAVAERLAGQGFDIDLRIIGFDLDERGARAFDGIGIFENTGSAAELAEALGRAIEIEQPTRVETYRVTVRLTRGGQPAVDGATLSFVDSLASSQHPFTPTGDGTFTADLPAGGYRAEVNDAFAGNAHSFASLSVGAEAANTFEFELALEAEVALTVDPADPITGAEVSISFSGAPAGAIGWITVVPVTAADQEFLDYAAVVGQSGEAPVRVPFEQVELEARYHLRLPEGGTRVLGRSAAFSSRTVTTSLDAPSEVPGGSTFGVAWEGPANYGDFVTVVAVGARDADYLSYFYTRDGNPGSLTAPVDPGQYELRYVSGGGEGVLARRAVTVTEVAISVEAPSEVRAGERFDVTWQGPNGNGDYITIVNAGASEGSYLSYAYTRDGNPAGLDAPVDAGDYQVWYVSGQGNRTVARRPIRVTAVEVSVDAPGEVTAGQTFEVSWQGPNSPGDYLTIVRTGAPAGSYLSYAYTRDGVTLRLTAPNEAGSYEVRYVHGGSNRTLASAAVQVR